MKFDTIDKFTVTKIRSDSKRQPDFQASLHSRCSFYEFGRNWRLLGWKEPPTTLISVFSWWNFRYLSWILKKYDFYGKTHTFYASVCWIIPKLQWFSCDTFRKWNYSSCFCPFYFHPAIFSWNLTISHRNKVFFGQNSVQFTTKLSNIWIKSPKFSIDFSILRILNFESLSFQEKFVQFENYSRIPM